MKLKTKHLWDSRLLTNQESIGRKKLRLGFLLYSIVVFLPIVGILAYSVITEPKLAIGMFFAIVFHGGFYTVFLPLFLFSPYLVLRGSNQARTLSGVIALLLAMGTFLGMTGVFSGELAGIIAGVISIIAFPIFCYLTNVFLICEKVKAFICVIRSRRGLSSESWKLDD